MGILQKNSEIRRQRILKQQEEERRLKQLSKDEIKYLLGMLAQRTFEGLEVQIVYNITAKLQNQLKS
jgi:hypothetical protein